MARITDDPSHLFTLHVKTWSDKRPIVIYAFDANDCDPRTGHNRIDVEVRQGGRVIFPRGSLYCATNRWTTVDGIEARELVLSLVAMRPGDTDDAYFDSYTEEQRAWAIAHGEALGYECMGRYCDENGDARKGSRK